jgi:hypothetical protein
VEPGVAQSIASRQHEGQRNRFGDPVIDHVQRVAAAFPPHARATALLHDLYELCPTAHRQLRGKHLTRTELEALELLTHASDEPYEVYVRRIADPPGLAGRLARIGSSLTSRTISRTARSPWTLRRTRGRANYCAQLMMPSADGGTWRQLAPGG